MTSLSLISYLNSLGLNKQSFGKAECHPGNTTQVEDRATHRNDTVGVCVDDGGFESFWTQGWVRLHNE